MLSRSEPSTHTGARRAVGAPVPMRDRQGAVSAPVPRADGVVVDLRRPEQLVLEVARPSVEIPLLAPNEGLLGASRWERAAKRLMDLVISTALLLLLSPVLVAAVVMVRLSSRGPVFYTHERVGYRGRSFRFIKFRTMKNGAHEERGELDDLNEVDGPVFKIRDDPRITRSGRILRRFSIDELPQLLHVLSGKMSLVGPRPPLPEEVARYGRWEAQRLLVKPGLTCIWQVSGRSDLDFHTWVWMDIEYISTWSLWGDVKLLARTLPAVVSGRGAY